MKNWIKTKNGNLVGIANGALAIRKTEPVEVDGNWECEVIAGPCAVLHAFDSTTSQGATDKAQEYIDWLCSNENLNGTVIIDDTDDF